MTPAPGKTPKRHMASEIAGFVCPPEALPSGLRINPASKKATAAPTIQSSVWIPVILREMGDGPITHLTILTTPKSRKEVRISSNALSRASRRKLTRSCLLDSPEDRSNCSSFQFGVRKRSNRSRDSKVPCRPRSIGAFYERRNACHRATTSRGSL